MPTLRFGDLVEDLPSVSPMTTAPWQHLTITGITTDSRRVGPGFLFVALPGSRENGLRFVGEARRHGAVAVLAPEVPGMAPSPLPLLVSTALRRDLARISRRFYGSPDRQLDLAGITGTNGKTTTATMVAQMLEAAERPVAYWTTSWVDSGRRTFRPSMTTPLPPALYQFLRDAQDIGKDSAVLEVSSHAVSTERIYGLAFKVGVVTNVSPDHLDFHGSFRNYAAAKHAFIRGLPPTAEAVLNGDDAIVRSYVRGTKARTWSVGLGEHNHLRAVNVRFDGSGSRFLVRFDPLWLKRRRLSSVPRTLPIRLPVPGVHNVYNALAAMAAGFSLGVTPRHMAAALAHFTPPLRRLERFVAGPVTIISDVAMNPASFDAVLETVLTEPGPTVVVIAIRGNRGMAVNAAIADVLARWNHRRRYAPLIVSLSNSQLGHLSVDHRVRPEELSAFLRQAEAAGLECEVYSELPSAIDAAVMRLKGESRLLLLGTFGMDDGVRLASERLGHPQAAPPAVDD